ncbi:uncharacterized protein [Primulina eburnea]|uniref:uncharacterized protein n=1 Tax=Primulina eburnea TaxID=1245227 RepID=UPI003C6CC264
MEIVVKARGGWCLTEFYGFPERHRRRDSWNLLRTITDASTLPCCIIGDFNDLSHIEDNQGRVEHHEWLFNGFRTAVNDCALQEISMQGYQFTWSRSRGKPNAVEERLDRDFGNSEWMALFPDAQVNNPVAAISDHSPLLLRTIQPEIFLQKRKFRFENKWLRELDFKELVYNSWDAGSCQDLLPRLERCSELLSNWGKQCFAFFKRSINQYKQKLEQLRHYSDPDSVEEYDTIRKNMIDLFVQEEDHWCQRTKSFWLSEGDLNTKFFHANANARRRSNQITRLHDGNGIWYEDKTDISHIDM